MLCKLTVLVATPYKAKRSLRGRTPWSLGIFSVSSWAKFAVWLRLLCLVLGLLGASSAESSRRTLYFAGPPVEVFLFWESNSCSLQPRRYALVEFQSLEAKRRATRKLHGAQSTRPLAAVQLSALKVVLESPATCVCLLRAARPRLNGILFKEASSKGR